VDSNVTRARADRGQLSVLVDAGLLGSVRVAAAARGWSLSGFVERALEVMLDDSGIGPGGAGGVGASGADAGLLGGRVGVDGVVKSDVGRSEVDWDALLVKGRESRFRDPIEEIA